MASLFSFEKKFKKLFWNLATGIISSTKKSAAEKIRSVLVLRPDRLGDFVLSVPALEALQKEMGPSSRWTLVAGERNADLARFCFPKANIWIFKKNIISRIILCMKVWLNSFDAVIDFHSYPFSTTTALLTVLSGSPIRSGFWAAGDFAEYNNVSKKVFKDGIKAPSENLSEVLKSFLLIEKVFPTAKLRMARSYFKNLPTETAQKVRAFYFQSGIGPNDMVLGIHPTLQKQDNRWSQKHYLELIRQLGSIKGSKFVVLHGKGEEAELREFMAQAGHFPNVFALPVNDLFFILGVAQRFDALVCNDSGLMHVCAWVTNVFAVFGPSNPQRWGPQNRPGVKHQVFRTVDGLCDSVKPRKVALAVKKELF